MSSERRKFPRLDIEGDQVRATLVLTGGSLLKENSINTFEVPVSPVNLSRSGIGITLKFDASWSGVTPKRVVELLLEPGKSSPREVQLVLETGESKKPVKGRIVYRREKQVGLEFSTPLQDITRFLLPKELSE